MKINLLILFKVLKYLFSESTNSLIEQNLKINY